MANAKGSCKKCKYKNESHRMCRAEKPSGKQMALRERHFEWHHLQGSLPSCQQGCGCAQWDAPTAPHGNMQHIPLKEHGLCRWVGAHPPNLCSMTCTGRSKAVFWGRGKPHTGDSGLPHALFYAIPVNWFILFHRVAIHWRQESLGGTTGNSGSKFKT